MTLRKNLSVKKVKEKGNGEKRSDQINPRVSVNV